MIVMNNDGKLFDERRKAEKRRNCVRRDKDIIQDDEVKNRQKERR